MLAHIFAILPSSLLLKVQGAEPHLTEIDAKLQGTQPFGDKKMRAKMRALLAHVIGKHVGTFGKKEAKIADIPEKLFLMSDQAKEDPVDAGEEQLVSVWRRGCWLAEMAPHLFACSSAYIFCFSICYNIHLCCVYCCGYCAAG